MDAQARFDISSACASLATVGIQLVAELRGLVHGRRFIAGLAFEGGKIRAAYIIYALFSKLEDGGRGPRTLDPSDQNESQSRSHEGLCPPSVPRPSMPGVVLILYVTLPLLCISCRVSPTELPRATLPSPKRIPQHLLPINQVSLPCFVLPRFEAVCCGQHSDIFRHRTSTLCFAGNRGGVTDVDVPFPLRLELKYHGMSITAAKKGREMRPNVLR